VDQDEWDKRYAAAELLWGVEPNVFVARELASLPTGRSLDRSAALAERAGVSVEWGQ
jgi:hypothetical protein